MKTQSLTAALKAALPEQPITDEDLAKIRARLAKNLRERFGFSEADGSRRPREFPAVGDAAMRNSPPATMSVGA